MVACIVKSGFAPRVFHAMSSKVWSVMSFRILDQLVRVFFSMADDGRGKYMSDKWMGIDRPRIAVRDEV